MTKELTDIYNNYREARDVGDAGDDGNGVKVGDDIRVGWLDYLSHPSVADTPVFYSGIQTPSGFSYGSNVTFSGIMRESKKIYDNGVKNEIFVGDVSSRLQDYAIGLHEDRGLLTQSQTSELIMFLQDKNNVRYFLDHYDIPMEVKTPSLDLTASQSHPKKVEPTYSAEDYVILDATVPKYDGLVLGVGVDAKARFNELFKDVVEVGVLQSSLTLRTRIQNEREKSRKESMLDSLVENDDEIRKLLSPETYQRLWGSFSRAYDEATEFGTKNMPQEALEKVNSALSEVSVAIQRGVSDRFWTLKEEHRVQMKVKPTSLLKKLESPQKAGVEMGM
jgi:hypothetical protein